MDCSRTDGDQLTWELLDFVQAVTLGVKPRVDGIAGARAVEISTMILDSICSHRWKAPLAMQPGLGICLILKVNYSTILISVKMLQLDAIVHQV